MALSNVTTAVSDGGTSGGKLDMDINAESFYTAYKTIENVYEPFDSLSSAVSSISAAVSALGVNFSSISTKIKTDSKELSDMCVRMKAFKTTLEKVDSSNALLFAEMDLTMFENFGEDMSETDQALYIEKCTMIYNLAVKKDPEDLTELEKNIIENLDPYMKLNKYIDAENKYNEVNAKYEDLNSQIYNLSRTNGALADEDAKKLASLVKERDALKSGWLELKTNKESLRSELIDMGVLEMTAGESLEAAGKQLWGNFTDMFKTGGDLGAFLVEADEFMSALEATGAVVATNVIAGVGKVSEYIIDGVIMVGTGVASAGTGLYDGINAAYSGITGSKYTSATKSMWNKTMDLISNDTTGDIYNSFYQTGLGEMINNTSALKYDSAGATAVKDVSIKATEVIAATAVTVATGGAAAPFVAAGIGFLEGTGKTAEERFSAGNREVKDIGLAFLGGVGKASEWYGYGQVGSNIYNGAKNFLTKNVSQKITEETLKESFKTAGKSNLKVLGEAVKKTFTTADVYLDSAAAVANAVTTKITTGEWNVGEGLFDLGFAVAGNMVGDILSGFADRRSARKTLTNIFENVNTNADSKAITETINEISDGINTTGKIDIQASKGNLGTISIGNENYDIEELVKLDNAKVKEIIPKPLTYQSKIEALTILGALPSDKMNSVLKDMDYSTMKRLFDNPYLTSSVIEKLDITDAALVKSVVGHNNIYKDIFSDEQIYKMFTSLDPEISDVGRIFLALTDEPRFVSLFNDYNFSRYGAKLFSDEVICESLLSYMGPDYIKNTFGTDGLYNLLDNIPTSNSRTFLMNYLTDTDLTNYFNHLKDTGDIKTIIDISGNDQMLKDFKYKYLQAVFNMDDCDGIVKQIDFQKFLSDPKTSELFKNLSLCDTDKLNELLIPDGAKVFERTDGSKYFIKHDSNFDKVVNGRTLYAYWFSDSLVEDKLVYSQFMPLFMKQDLDSALLQFLNEEYFNSNRIASLVNFNSNGSFLGFITQDADGKLKYIYTNEVMLNLNKNRDNFLSFFGNGKFEYGNYGVNQAALKRIDGSQKLSDIAKRMGQRYKADPNMLKYFLGKANTVDGICSYADLCDKIFIHYLGREADFLHDFGYSMYNTNWLGNKKLNTEELLADLYIFNNSSINGGNLFDYDPNTKSFSVLASAKTGISKSFGAGDINSDVLENNFFRYHGIPLEISSSTLRYQKLSNDIIEKVNAEISRGNIPSIITYYNSINYPLTFEEIDINSIVNNNVKFSNWIPNGNYQSTKSWSSFDAYGKIIDSSSHITPVIGIDKDYMYIASWGRPYRIKISDINNTNSFITIQTIKDLTK